MELTPRCPTCRAIIRWDGNDHRPFCSDRCQLIDLGSWANEQYRVPGEPAEPEPPDDDDSNGSGST
jgi:hypothetical protein